MQSHRQNAQMVEPNQHILIEHWRIGLWRQRDNCAIEFWNRPSNFTPKSHQAVQSIKYVGTKSIEMQLRRVAGIRTCFRRDRHCATRIHEAAFEERFELRVLQSRSIKQCPHDTEICQSRVAPKILGLARRSQRRASDNETLECRESESFSGEVERCRLRTQGRNQIAACHPEVFKKHPRLFSCEIEWQVPRVDGLGKLIVC